MRGFCSRARSDPQQNEEFLGAKRTHRRWWEHTQVCGHVHTTRRVVSRAAERSGECATKKEIMHPAGALTCTCTRSHMYVPDSVHTCAHKCASGECATKKEIMHPAGALTCTCTRSHMYVPESVHTCAHKCASGECAHMHVHVCTRRVHEIHAPEA